MKHTILLLLLLLLSVTVAGQSIDYTLGILDVNKSPVLHRQLEQTFEAPNGVYLQYGFGLNSEESTLAFFDGEVFKEIYTSTQEVDIVGATNDGAFVTEKVANRNLLFIDRNNIRVDTLNSRPLPLPETYQLGDKLFTFSYTTGVIAYTADGEETLVRSQYNDCVCSPADRYLEIGDRLVYNNQNEYFITDGTSDGTRRIFEGEGRLLAMNDLVLKESPNKLEVYDPTTMVTVDLLANLPGNPGPILETGPGVITQYGLLFSVKTEGRDRELYITDGTVPGTRALDVAIPGGVTASTAVGQYMVFRDGSDEDNPDYWLSDGSTAGTYPIIKPKEGQTELGNLVLGYMLENGQLILDLYSFDSNTGSSIFAVDPSDGKTEASLVGRVPFRVSQENTLLVNDRLLTGGDYQTDSLFSFGSQPGDVLYVGKTGLFSELLYASSDVAYYLIADNGPEKIYTTRGEEEDLKPVLTVGYSGGATSSYAAIFSVSGTAFAHTFDPVYGEAIYRVDYGQATLVADLYPNNAGSRLVRIDALGDQVFWTAASHDGEMSYLSPGGSTEIRTFDPPVFIDSGMRQIGNIGPLYYFSTYFGVDGLYEVNSETATARAITEPFQGVVSNLVLLEDRFYSIRELPGSGIGPRILQTISFNPVDGRIEVILTDTTTSQKYGPQAIVTDGRLVYFTTGQASETGPTVYDPMTGITTKLGRIEARSGLAYRRIGDRVVVTYQNPDFREDSRLLTATGFGPVLQLNTYGYFEATILNASLIAVGNKGTMYSFNDDKGSATPLTDGTDEYQDIRQLTPISSSEALFFRKRGEDWTVWRTDGTVAGTRQLAFLEDTKLNDPLKLQPIGNYVAVLTHRTFGLLDPRSGEFEPIPVELSHSLPQPQLAVVGNHLYFAAVHPVFGEELHYLSIEGGSEPPNAVRDQLNIEVRLYPNPTTDWVRVETHEVGTLTATLYDVRGWMLEQSEFRGEVTMNLANYPAGTYVLRVDDPATKRAMVLRVVHSK